MRGGTVFLGEIGDMPSGFSAARRVRTIACGCALDRFNALTEKGILAWHADCDSAGRPDTASIRKAAAGIGHSNQKKGKS